MSNYVLSSTKKIGCVGWGGFKYVRTTDEENVGGGLGKFWQLTKGGGMVGEMLTMADIICEQPLIYMTIGRALYN